jgi:hypothetical protein
MKTNDMREQSLMIARSLLICTFIMLIASATGGATKKLSNEVTIDKTAATIVQTKQEVPANESLATSSRISTVDVAMAPSEGPYDIRWQVISRGATDGASANYKLRGTLDQTAVGEANSEALQVLHGFWQDFVTSASGCCIGIRGNANADGNQDINISDITYLVDYSFGIPLGPAPPCPEEGNANGDGNGDINISDITYLVDYLFGIPLGPAPPVCP